MRRPLDVPLLRTFLLLLEEGSVTRAAHRLGRTQPAVSLQIRRLEDAAGRKLFEPDLRRLRLTRHGDALRPYAERIVRLHDEAQLSIGADEIAGRVVLGCPDLYASMLPATLASFRVTYPLVEVTVRCALTMVLAKELSAGQLDLALATRMPNVTPRVGATTALRREPLVWMGALRGRAHLEPVLPIAMLPEGNLYRDHALARLDSAGRRWRIACTSESIAGLTAMALADSAVTVLARSALPTGLRVLGPDDGLPALPSVELLLWNRAPGAAAAADQLALHISEQII
jgi:DNA-binding transcriptional LysR family regulator